MANFAWCPGSSAFDSLASWAELIGSVIVNPVPALPGSGDTATITDTGTVSLTGNGNVGTIRQRHPWTMGMLSYSRSNP